MIDLAWNLRQPRSSQAAAFMALGFTFLPRRSINHAARLPFTLLGGSVQEYVFDNNILRILCDI